MIHIDSLNFIQEKFLVSSFYLCNSAAIEANLSKSAFHVYSYLALSANSKTRSSFKARATIANACGISVSTVVLAGRELCKKGLLKIRKRFDNRRQTSNLYILLDNQQPKVGSQTSQNVPKEKADEVIEETTFNAYVPSTTKAWLFKCNSAGIHSNLSSNALKIFSISVSQGRQGWKGHAAGKRNRGELRNQCVNSDTGNSSTTPGGTH